MTGRFPQSDGVTDRERVAAALVELTGRGYLVPFAPWEVCCASCGWEEVRRQFGVSDEEAEDDSWGDGLRVVWWHEQADAYAFAGDPLMVLQTDEFMERVPADDAEAEVWFEEHGVEAAADTVTARTTKYVDLQSVLQLHWLGDAEEIVAALRGQGLRVVAPASVDECVAVVPVVSGFTAAPVRGEVLVSAGDDSMVLGVEEARVLGLELLAAADAAERETPPSLW